ncbi:MAG TPA: hypothetical protein VH877_22270 [Polyangia bacterium]|jgi:hypothetical protein|nr:hypothetical protein [Polyangia bacterium]
MDFIFDDEVDESGAEIDAFCPKCKADTAHVVVHKYEDEIRRVQCTPCGDVHPYRKPRGADEEEAPEPVVKKRPAKAKPTWEQVMAKPRKEIKPYVISQEYRDGDLISHPTFGAGFVSESIGPDKIEITFQSGRRILVHNRRGMSLPASTAITTPPAAVPAASPSVRDQGQGQRSRTSSRGESKAKPKAPPKIREVPPPPVAEEAEEEEDLEFEPEEEEAPPRRSRPKAAESPAEAKPRMKDSAKSATKKPVASSAKPRTPAKGEKKTAAKPPAAKPKTQAKARAAAPVRSKPARAGAKPKPAAGKKVKKR